MWTSWWHYAKQLQKFDSSAISCRRGIKLVECFTELVHIFLCHPWRNHLRWGLFKFKFLLKIRLILNGVHMGRLQGEYRLSYIEIASRSQRHDAFSHILLPGELSSLYVVIFSSLSAVLGHSELRCQSPLFHFLSESISDDLSHDSGWRREYRILSLDQK